MQCKKFASVFGERPFNNYAVGTLDAFTAINQAHIDLSAVQKDAIRLKTLADLFDFPELMTETLENLKVLRETLIWMKHMWDIAMYVDRQLAYWKKTLWNDIDTNEMDDQIKRIPKDLRSLAKEVRYA
jgi:hypothetical protein